MTENAESNAGPQKPNPFKIAPNSECPKCRRKVVLARVVRGGRLGTGFVALDPLLGVYHGLPLDDGTVIAAPTRGRWMVPHGAVCKGVQDGVQGEEGEEAQGEEGSGEAAGEDSPQIEAEAGSHQ